MRRLLLRAWQQARRLPRMILFGLVLLVMAGGMLLTMLAAIFAGILRRWRIYRRQGAAPAPLLLSGPNS